MRRIKVIKRAIPEGLGILVDEDRPQRASTVLLKPAYLIEARNLDAVLQRRAVLRAGRRGLTAPSDVTAADFADRPVHDLREFG